MTVRTIPFNQVLSSSKLLNALLDTFPRVAPFYTYDLHDDEIWARMIGLVDKRAHTLPGSGLASVLLEQNRRFGADAATLANAEALGRADTYAIMTGQQVGLLTGPLYTIYKAMTAVRAAQRLEHRLGRRIVPVFWMASDDHDFHEINHVHVCNQANEVIRLELTPETSIDRRSAVHIPFGPGIIQLIDNFIDALPDSEFKPLIAEFLHESCSPEVTFSEGFARLLTRLFQGRGLVIVDPSDAALKPFMRPIFEQEIRSPLNTTQAVLEAASHLERTGFQPQIDRTPDAMNIFMYHEGCRTPLTYGDDRVHLRHTDVSYTIDELMRMVETSPESFSQNVVTRPIVQDALFPALAYVAGPAEVAYYAQLTGVYDYFDLPYPIVYPRASMTIVERRVGRVLEKWDLSVEDFLDDIYQIVGQRMRDEIPDEVTQVFDGARTALAEHYGRLAEQVTTIEPTLQNVADSARRKSEFELSKLEDKTVQAIKRAHKTMRQQIEKADPQLYPRHQMQERMYNIWSYIGLYGFEFMDILYEAVDDTDFSHRVVSL